jgi:hypothetical protein
LQHDGTSARPGADEATDLEIARRALRVRLLRDLVHEGLYRLPSERLAERLLARPDLRLWPGAGAP